MALSRKFLTALGIEAEKIDEIINAHSETVEALKEERDSYKAKAEQSDKLQKDLDSAKKQIEDLNKDDAYKVKYEALKEDFEQYKSEQAQKEIHTKKETVYRNLLQEVGISDKRINAVLKVSDVDAIELDDEGNAVGADVLKQSIGEEWADFIVTTETVGAKTATPPTGNGKVYKSKDEIMAIRDTKERQQAIADNHDLFGF